MHGTSSLTRRELGRAGWALLHTLAAYYPENPTPEEQRDMEKFMRAFIELYPCHMCRDASVLDMADNKPRVGYATLMLLVDRVCVSVFAVRARRAECI